MKPSIRDIHIYKKAILKITVFIKSDRAPSKVYF